MDQNSLDSTAAADEDDQSGRHVDIDKHRHTHCLALLSHLAPGHSGPECKQGQIWELRTGNSDGKPTIQMDDRGGGGGGRDGAAAEDAD